MKRCDRLDCDVGLLMIPLKEGGEDRAKQSLRGHEVTGIKREDATPSHGSFQG